RDKVHGLPLFAVRADLRLLEVGEKLKQPFACDDHLGFGHGADGFAGQFLFDIHLLSPSMSAVRASRASRERSTRSSIAALRSLFSSSRTSTHGHSTPLS